MKNLLCAAVFCAALCFPTFVRAEDVNDLIQKLQSPTDDVRRDAAQELGKLGAEARDAVPALTKALQDKNLFVRRYSAQTLGKIGLDAKEAVSGLAKALDDKHKEVAEAAAEALGHLGAGAVTPLTKTFRDKGNEAAVRRKAVEALGAIGSQARTAVPALTDALKDKDVQTEAATALGNIGPAAKSALSALNDAVKSKGKNKAFKKAAADAIRKIQTAS
jgi:HEAT repeat protein